MFTPFSREEGLLDSGAFLRDEVRFNLLHKILEDPRALTLRSPKHDLLAAQNAGFRMWLWVDDELDTESSTELVHSFCYELKDNRLPGIAGRPEQANAFAEEYARLTGAAFSVAMGLESYHCPEVILPQNVVGKMVSPEARHLSLIAEFCVGFILDGYGKVVSKESQLASAERLINSGNLYLWEANGEIVCMANIAHRSKRHARINNVFTPPEHRKRGYASALVAAISSKILDEGLTPILFADVKTPASNKVYRSIGYKERGLITELDFKY